MPFVSIMTPCYNEEANVAELCRQVRAVMEDLPPRQGDPYTYEHILIDNASTDRTVDILREVCAADDRVKVIVNTRNFGHIRSPYYGLLQGRGDAVITLVADLQDPPTMIAEFLHHWEQGYKVVVGVKQASHESRLMFLTRRQYYRVVDWLSEVPQIRNFTGFGLYDREVIQTLRDIDDPYPYFRGLISELGYARVEMPYSQPARRGGISKNNFYSLYDLAMLGITNHSKVPLRDRGHRRVHHVRDRAPDRVRVPNPQARVVGHVRPRLGAFGDRRVLLRERSAVLHRHPRRIHRVDPHAGLSPPTGGREGAHQL